MKERDWNTGDAWCCEQHPDKPFPHFKEMFLKCEGPGMPDFQGRATIKWLKQGLERILEHGGVEGSHCAFGHGKMVKSILDGNVTHL